MEKVENPEDIAKKRDEKRESIVQKDNGFPLIFCRRTNYFVP